MTALGEIMLPGPKPKGISAHKLDDKTRALVTPFYIAVVSIKEVTVYYNQYRLQEQIKRFDATCFLKGKRNLAKFIKAYDEIKTSDLLQYLVDGQ